MSHKNENKLPQNLPIAIYNHETVFAFYGPIALTRRFDSRARLPVDFFSAYEFDNAGENIYQ